MPLRSLFFLTIFLSLYFFNTKASQSENCSIGSPPFGSELRVELHPTSNGRTIQRSDATSFPKWTCILYLAGDNFLDWFTLQNLEELRQAGSSPDVRVVVFADRTDNKGYLYEVRKDYLVELPLEAIEPSWKGKEPNTGDPDTLATFASWAIENLPAQNYLLLLGGYGEGWMGLLHDFNDGQGKVDILTLDELEGALAQTIKSIKKTNGKDRIDILGLDACYMAMVEVLYQIGDYARYVITSENEEALDGWPYDKVIRAFIEGPSLSPSYIASQVVDYYIDSAQWVPTKLSNVLTASVIHAEVFREITPLLDELSLLLKDTTPRHMKEMLEVDRLAKTFTVSAHIAGRYVPYSMHYDLGGFLLALRTRFRDEPSLDGKAKKVADALSQAIVKERHQELKDQVVSLGGLTIFGMGAELEGYKRLAFSQRSHWDDFVEMKMKSLEEALKGGR
jgi:hypothetical protein